MSALPDKHREKIRQFVMEKYGPDLDADCKIDSDLPGINRDLEDFPGILGKWVKMEQDSRKIVEGFDAKIEVANAELYLAAPATLEAEGRKPTVEAIKAKITLHPGLRKLVEERDEWKHNLNLLVAGRQVIMAKRDCLMARASNMRAEMDAQLYVAKSKMKEIYPKGGKK